MDAGNVDFLREVVFYDPDTGRMIWKERCASTFSHGLPSYAKRWNKRHAGKDVGTLHPHGYISTVINNKRAMVHRIAWVVHYGEEIPKNAQIDHINGNRSDNRIANLRLCTPSQNVKNRTRKNGGAFYHKSTGKWQSALRIHLGTFETQEEAAAAYEEVAKALHGRFFKPNGEPVNVSRVV